MPITIDYSNMFPAFNMDEIDSYSTRIKQIHEDLKHLRQKGKLPFYDLPYQDVGRIREFADSLSGRFKNIIVLGIGGSALGLTACNSALRSPYGFSRNDPCLYVMDNIDPERIAAVLKQLDPHESIVNVITKSGSTAETMASFLIFRKWLIDELGEKGYKERMIATTDREKGSLCRIARQEGIELFTVPDGVGGRFSVLTPVGLLPAALLGMDIESLLSGAAEMDKRLICNDCNDLFKNPAYLGAVFHYLGYYMGRNIPVMFAYSDRLLHCADWYGQLWAESLGKRVDLDGGVVSVGPTPVKALGVTDQHSQVQLYKEGPDDKIYTFLNVEQFKDTVEIPKDYSDVEAISYLGGHTLNELLNAEEQATEFALIKAGRPVTTVSFPEVTAKTLGAFFYWLEVQTLAAGALFRINPLDQPGVEEGKHFAYGIMGRPGYEEKRKEMESFKKRDHALIFKASN